MHKSVPLQYTMLSSVMQSSRLKRKRKRSTSRDDADDDIPPQMTSSVGRSQGGGGGGGGEGIHRPNAHKHDFDFDYGAEYRAKVRSLTYNILVIKCIPSFLLRYSCAYAFLHPSCLASSIVGSVVQKLYTTIVLNTYFEVHNIFLAESKRWHKKEGETRPLCLFASDETEAEQKKAGKAGWAVLWLHEESQEGLSPRSKAAQEKKIKKYQLQTQKLLTFHSIMIIMWYRLITIIFFNEGKKDDLSNLRKFLVFWKFL